MSRQLTKSADAKAAFDLLNSSSSSWGAQMYLGGRNRHKVIVDGLNEAGMVMVRDPWEGNRYDRLQDDFLDNWEQIALFGQ